MAIVKKICKVCGNEYEYCHTARKPGIFRWQDIACSPEHASEYLAKIRASRLHEYFVDNLCSTSDNVVEDTMCATDVIATEVILDDDDDGEEVED